MRGANSAGHADGPDGAPATRIVSLAPSATEWILALDAVDRLVARTVHDDDPRLAELPAFGTTTPSPEAILGLEPDLVLLMDEPGTRPLARALDGQGVRHVLLRPETIPDVFAVGRRIGEWVGDSAQADALADRLERRLEAVRARNGDASRPTVLYVLWPDPPRAAGAGTFVGEVIEAGGGRVAFPELDDGWPEVGLEAIVARDPDVLLVPDAVLEGDAVDRLREMPGWNRMSAVREGRVVEVDGALFERPGPRVFEAAEHLAGALVAIRRGPAFAPESSDTTRAGDNRPSTAGTTP